MAQHKLYWIAGSCFTLTLTLAALPGCSSDPETAPAPSAGTGGSGTSGTGGSASGSGGTSGTGGSASGSGGTAGTTGGTAGGGSGGTGGDTGGTAGSGGTGGDTGGTAGSGGTGGGAASQVCTDYCAENAVACAAQFATDYPGGEGDCLTGCAAMTEGGMTDYSGNTAWCRLNHTRNVATMGESHCQHAKLVADSPCQDI
jgi:hypothetical protein